MDGWGFVFAFWLLPFVISVLIVVALVVVVFVGIARNGRETVPIDPSRPVSLYARVFRPDRRFSVDEQFDPQLSGRLTVSNRRLFWDPDEGESWATPISAITVLGTGGAMALSDPHVDIDIEGSGHWRLVVSDRPINRFVTNDFKRFQEAGRAQELAQELLRDGARKAL